MDENTNTNEAAKSLEDLRALARDIDELALALTHGEKMGEFTMALRLDTFSDRIRQALGEMPRMGEKVADFQKRQETLFAAASAAIREATELAAGAKAASDIPPHDKPISPDVPEMAKGGALRAIGYEAEDDKVSGCLMVKIPTPYEGATIRALLYRRDASGRNHGFSLWVENNRGIGWTLKGSFVDCGRYVAKAMLLSMALELRRAYTHRGQKCHKRAIARAKAKMAAVASRRLILHTPPVRRGEEKAGRFLNHQPKEGTR